MPPKAKATKKTPKAGDGDGDASTGNSTNTRVDKYIDQFYDRQEKADNALLGYARMDIIKRSLEFGRYNTRELNLKEKASLVDSFLSNGLDRYGQSHAIHLIVKLDDIILETVKKPTDIEAPKRDGSHLPWLLFKNDSGIVAAGGRHRRAALIDWVKTKRNGLTLAKCELKDLQAKSKENAESVAEEEMSAAEEMVDHLNGLVNAGGSWIVAVYDEGECFSI